MRVTLRGTGVTLLWVLAAWPLLLVATAAATPVVAVRIEEQTLLWSGRAAYGAAGLLVVLTILWPPCLPGIRFAGALMLQRLRADSGPWLKAVGELRSFESAARQLEAGRAALLAGMPVAAIGHLARALELEPESVAARHLLGTALLKLGRPADAAAAFAVVVDLEPGHAFGDALLSLGRARMLLGDDRGAAEVLDRHRREHGGTRKSHFWLAECLWATGDRDGARQVLAVAAAPPPPRPRLVAEESWYRARARVWLRFAGTGTSS